MPEDTLPFSSFNIENLPQNEDEVRARHEANRAGWNEGAIHYTQNIEETIAFLRAGKSNLHTIERRNLVGKLGNFCDWCRTAVHLQCASGRDTLSLWNEGVERVIGVDISDVHIQNARQISAALNASAEWYRCDVLDTPHELDGLADLVYTGRGALCWLQDLDAYANVVYRLLKPGGVYHVLDDHPAAFLFDTEAETLQSSGFSYFGQCDSSVGWPTSYIGDSIGIPPEKQSRKYERGWNLMEIFNALTQAGLVVEYLGEHPDPYWEVFPNLRAELRGQIPLTFSMLARRNT
jgi:SAM-dependent methyltransferase